MASHSYFDLALRAAPRLLSTLDREELSPTAGNFDRDHWAWKFRDFPITMLQAGVLPLAQLWRSQCEGNPYFQSERVREWIARAVAYTCGRQHRHGGFASVAPNAFDHGVTLAVVHILARVAEATGGALGSSLDARIRESIHGACRFAMRTREDYAFISNHQALFALAWLDAHRILDEAPLRQRADEVIAAILAHQSPDGWFAEYGGPDPGYETLGIWYLAQVWRRTADAKLLDALRRSVTFLSHTVHPDGSLGGVYGSRQTHVYYPGGLELLRDAIPEAGAMARFLLRGVTSGAVVTPLSCDAANLAILTSSYLDAALASADHAGGPDQTEARLPCEVLNGVRTFSDSRIFVVGQPRYYAVASAARGGVLRVFSRGPKARLLYQDAGVVARMGSQTLASQAGSRGQLSLGDDGAIVCETPLSSTASAPLTPFRFVVLRILNLTAFRVRILADLFRRFIVRRLVTHTVPSGVRLRRTLRFDAEGVVVHDQLLGRTGALREVAAPATFTPMHMGSARYFTSTELETTPTPPSPGPPTWQSRFALVIGADESAVVRDLVDP